MKVQLTSSRVTCENGDFVPQKIGDVIDVSDAEGQRMIENRQAKTFSVVAPARSAGTPAAPRKATKPRGRNAKKR